MSQATKWFKWKFCAEQCEFKTCSFPSQIFSQECFAEGYIRGTKGENAYIKCEDSFINLMPISEEQPWYVKTCADLPNFTTIAFISQ